ncbi:uncharacterized protein LOC119669415 [Teleopsis dalmanni]|uniref:uncharacterized protein LOC119669415 n=1 Tax=Teleopsis dalmanni TaxID=139649 RepID=UPI0018CC923D|nr:uncharacterized protein LOC119669415 [Teleopsis dalmanni]
MWFTKFLALILVFFIINIFEPLLPQVAGDRQLDEDCKTLRVRCGYCINNLKFEPSDYILINDLNQKCRMDVGRKYVWRNLNSCDMVYLRCKGVKNKIDCSVLADLAKMRKRLH